ncbi:MAG: ABC transporter substrate-binding protein [Anaerolineae bacterium]|nr:ABC transporter substrate-binding protein [Anaerolineae bacterium]
MFQSIASRVPRLIALVLIAMMTLIPLQAQESTGGTLLVGMNAPVNLDPASGSNDPEVLFNNTLYDTLLDVLPDGTIVENLATAYTISEDGLTYTLTLAEGVMFHDGAAFSSADVLFTFNRLQELESAALGLLSGGNFEIAAPDAQTVVFTLTEPNADFLYGLAGRLTSILKDGTTEPNVVVEGDTPYQNFNGTGAFRLTDYRAGERAVFIANADYFREGEPKLAGLEFVFIEDAQAQVDALITGEVHFIFKLPINQAIQLEAQDGITLLERATNQHGVIRIRSDEGFIGADPRIRQAFKLATDREELNLILQEGRAVIGNNDPIGPAFGLYYDATITTTDYDPAQACALILEATGQERISLDFYVVDALGYPDMATVLRQQWAEGCIDVNILVRPENVYYGNNEWMEVELGLTGWGDRPIPQQYLIEAYITGGIYNESHWSNEALDALVAEAGRTTDPTARAELYRQIAQIFATDGPIIVPYFAPIFGAVRNEVQGLEMAPFPGNTDFRNVMLGN